MNGTMCPSGLFPTLFSFGALPSLPVSTTDYAMQRKSMKSLHTSVAEMTSSVASSRIAQALSSKLPPVARYRINPGDYVRVNRERSDKWEGPCQVQCVSGTEVWLADPGEA